MDTGIESLVALVADAYGLECGFSGDRARLSGTPQEFRVDLPLAELRRLAAGGAPEDLPTLVSEHLAVVRAATRIVTEEAPHIEEADLGGLRGWLLTGGSAGDLRRLDEYLPVGEHGALIVVPATDVALVHSVESVGAVHAVERMRLFARSLWESDPDPVSPYVHWWRRTSDDLVELTRISADIDGNRIVLAPPPTFSKVLVELAAS